MMPLPGRADTHVLTSADAKTFVRRLRSRGYLAKVEVPPPGSPVGYAVQVTLTPDQARHLTSLTRRRP